MKFQESLGETIWAISRVLYDATSPDWAHPSSARRVVIAKIQSTIAPYNADLSALAFNRDDASRTLATQSFTLLKYTQPDDSLARSLRQHLTERLNQSGPVAELLFEYRLLNEDDKQTILAQFASEQDPDNRVRRALRLSKMGMPEGIPVFADLLSVPFTMKGIGLTTGPMIIENSALGGYEEATDAIEYLGTSAGSLVPLLKQRMEEIRAQLPAAASQAYLARFRVAIERAEGKRPVTTPIAMNGSGSLLPGTKPQETPKPVAPTVGTESTPPPSATPSNHTPAPIPTKDNTPSRAVERESSVSLWVAGMIALVAIIAVAVNRWA